MRELAGGFGETFNMAVFARAPLVLLARRCSLFCGHIDAVCRYGKMARFVAARGSLNKRSRMRGAAFKGLLRLL